jgi:hypothetical protein
VNPLNSQSIDMNKCVFIVLYPYKFTRFLWDLFKLDEFSKFAEVQVWDISKIINPGFSNSITAKSLYRKEVVNIESIVALILHLRAFVKQNKKNNICILNEVTRFSPMSLLVEFFLCFYLKFVDAKVLDQFNGGIPMSYPSLNVNNNSRNGVFGYFDKICWLIKDSANIRELAFRVTSYASAVIGKLFPTNTTHRLVAGSSWHNSALKGIKSGTKIIFGHSNDYSSYLTSLKLPFMEIHKRQKTAVLLDCPGPMFCDDYAITKRKVFFTSEVWYPALAQFFDYLEGKTEVIVEICGHYKSDHMSPAPCFGNRNVKYGLTHDMVRQSEYVMTCNSTAISYAVLYRKPVLFIYSTQLSFDSLLMLEINGMAEMLGTVPINIDNFPEDIERYLKVDEARYATYESEVLTSDPLGRPNHQIILEDIMGVSTETALYSDNKMSAHIK